MTEVAVLGCGPAGLLAALAVEQAGHTPVIYSRKIKSKMPGAQFLHVPIPEITAAEPDGTVNFLKVGPKHGYALKVYGDRSAPTSWDEFPRGEQPIWSMGEAYSRLWDRFEDRIWDFGHIDTVMATTFAEDFPLVFSTIPAPAMCEREEHHAFNSVPVYITSARTERRNNVIEYNGGFAQYYRRSVLFGSESMEYGAAVRLADVRLRCEVGWKPTTNDCDCHPEIHRLGRFGKWEKGVLVHHAYFEAKAALDAL